MSRDMPLIGGSCDPWERGHLVLDSAVVDLGREVCALAVLPLISGADVD